MNIFKPSCVAFRTVFSQQLFVQQRKQVLYFIRVKNSPLFLLYNLNNQFLSFLISSL